MGSDFRIIIENRACCLISSHSKIISASFRPEVVFQKKMKIFAFSFGLTLACKGNAMDDGTGMSAAALPLPHERGLERPPPRERPSPVRKPVPTPSTADDLHYQKLKSKIRQLIDGRLRDARKRVRIDIMAKKTTDEIEG